MPHLKDSGIVEKSRVEVVEISRSWRLRILPYIANDMMKSHAVGRLLVWVMLNKFQQGGWRSMLGKSRKAIVPAFFHSYIS